MATKLFLLMVRYSKSKNFCKIYKPRITTQISTKRNKTLRSDTSKWMSFFLLIGWKALVVNIISLYYPRVLFHQNYKIVA